MSATQAPPTPAPIYEREPNSGSELLRRTEWLLTDGRGGYAMGTALGARTRRYHGLLVASAAPPVHREVLLHSMVESVVLEPGTARERLVDLSSFRFRGGAEHPRGFERCVRFEKSDVCRWTYRVEDVEIVRTLRISREGTGVTLEYAIRPGATMVRLNVRPLVAMRDAHGLRQKHGSDFRVESLARSARVTEGSRSLELRGDCGSFETDAQWWYGFEYELERERGYDCHEDLFSPGALVLQARAGRAQTLRVTAWTGTEPREERGGRVDGLMRAAGAAVGNEASPADRAAVGALAMAADEFVVRRGDRGTSIIAGYPWFADWGRDSMISLPGLLLCLGRFEEAAAVLGTFAGYLKNGLLPNLFDDQSGKAEYNSVDASLWFLHAACEYRRMSGDRTGFEKSLLPACSEIIGWYRRGTDFGIAMDAADGLIKSGDERTPLTWMDAKRDGVAFTPRHGKAVEINALWHHGLLSVAEAMGDGGAELKKLAAKAATSFRAAFWNKSAGCCFDALSQGPKGTWVPDARIRPNQVFAASLRHSPLSGEQKRCVVEVVRSRLLTPCGLRTLDPADPGYKARYGGTMWQRDAAYHNGTAWPWLLGPFAEAVLRVESFSAAARARARAVLMPLISRLDGESMGQLPEVYDGDDSDRCPQAPGGCAAQAWSVAETLRVWLMTLGPAAPA